MTSNCFEVLKEDFLFEISYVTNIGSQVFVYPFIGRSKSSRYLYFIVFSFISITISQLFISLCLTKFQNWFEIINIIPNMGVCMLILLRYAKFHTECNIYHDIFNHFKNNLWDSIDEKSEKHKNVLTKNIANSKIITRFQFYYSLVLIGIVILFPRAIMYYDSEIKGNDIQYLYPFDGWYPFDKVEWYYVAYVWESLMTTIVIFLFTLCNVVHVALTRYICMELKILGITMEDLITDIDRENMRMAKLVKITHDRVQNKLKKIIRRHQVLKRIVSDLEDVLGAGMLLTHVFGSVFICLTIFTATVVDNLYLSLRYFSFFCSLLLEVFLQCIIGQFLMDHSAKLEQAIYFADWPNADKQTKKILLIFFICAQKPLEYSAKGYLVMNLDTFCGICNLSYQFFNLLHTATHS